MSSSCPRLTLHPCTTNHSSCTVKSRLVSSLVSDLPPPETLSVSFVTSRSGYASNVFRVECKHSGSYVVLKIYPLVNQPGKDMRKYQIYREVQIYRDVQIFREVQIYREVQI